MTRSDYFENAHSLLSNGKISEDVFLAMIDNSDAFVDEDEDDYYQLPYTYAEVEYDDFDDPEAIAGARFDDINFLRYFER